MEDMNKLTARIILGLIIALPIVGLAVMDYKQAAFILATLVIRFSVVLFMVYLVVSAIGK